MDVYNYIWLSFSASWYQPYHWTDRALLPTLTGCLLLWHTLPLLQDGSDRWQLLPLQGGATAGRGSLPEGPAAVTEGHVQDDAGSRREGTWPKSFTRGELTCFLNLSCSLCTCVYFVCCLLLLCESLKVAAWDPFHYYCSFTLQVVFHFHFSHSCYYSSLPILEYYNVMYMYMYLFHSLPPTTVVVNVWLILACVRSWGGRGDLHCPPFSLSCLKACTKLSISTSGSGE